MTGDAGAPGAGRPWCVCASSVWRAGRWAPPGRGTSSTSRCAGTRRSAGFAVPWTSWQLEAGDAVAVHHALHEVVALHPVLVRGAVGEVRERRLAELVILEPPERRGGRARRGSRPASRSAAARSGSSAADPASGTGCRRRWRAPSSMRAGFDDVRARRAARRARRRGRGSARSRRSTRRRAWSSTS